MYYTVDNQQIYLMKGWNFKQINKNLKLNPLQVNINNKFLWGEKIFIFQNNKNIVPQMVSFSMFWNVFHF